MSALIFNLGLFCVFLSAILFLSSLAVMFWKKSKIESALSIQCSSGDSEVMTFSSNFVTGESEDSKASKIHEAFQYIQDRRDENHAKWLKMKAEAIEENEGKTPEELKLRSITEGKK